MLKWYQSGSAKWLSQVARLQGSFLVLSLVQALATIAYTSSLNAAIAFTSGAMLIAVFSFEWRRIWRLRHGWQRHVDTIWTYLDETWRPWRATFPSFPVWRGRETRVAEPRSKGTARVRKGPPWPWPLAWRLATIDEGNEQDCRAGLYILVAIVSVKWEWPGKMSFHHESSIEAERNAEHLCKESQRFQPVSTAQDGKEVCRTAEVSSKF